MHTSFRVIGVLPDLMVSVILGLDLPLLLPVGGVRADARNPSAVQSTVSPESW
jgi:hypothetical protein